MKILVVDDHVDTLTVMSKLLRKWGFEADTAGDLRSARKLCNQSEYDLLIVDVGLPDGDGLDLVRSCGRKAIVLSGYAMESDINAAREAGAWEFLAKPLNMKKLMKVVHLATGKILPPAEYEGDALPHAIA